MTCHVKEQPIRTERIGYLKLKYFLTAVYLELLIPNGLVD